MGVSAGNNKLPAFDRIDHYFDPRNAKCNPKVSDNSSTSTEYTDAFRNKIPFNVSYHDMLHADGYLDFPVPTIGSNGASGEQGTKYRARFGDTANYNSGQQQILEIDTATSDGYCWMQWINVNKVPPVNTALDSSNTADSYQRRKMQVFAETSWGGDTANVTDDEQFMIYWFSQQDTDRITDADFAYSLLLENESVNDAGFAGVTIYTSPTTIVKDTWMCIVVQGSTNNTNGDTQANRQYYDVWIDDNKVRNSHSISTLSHSIEPSGTPAIWRLKWLGNQEDVGQLTHRPGMSFVGSMGPSVFWNRRLTDAEYLEAYNFFLNKLPT